MEESFDSLARIMFPDLVMGSQSCLSYFTTHKADFNKFWINLKFIPPEFLFARLKEKFPTINSHVPPILVLQAKQNNKKLKNFSFFIIGHEDSENSLPIYLYHYDQTTKEQTRSSIAVAAVVPNQQNDQALSIIFVDGTTSILYLNSNLESIMALVNKFNSKNVPSSLVLLIEFLQLMDDIPTMCPYIHEYFIALFRQNDLQYMREIALCPLSSKVKKTLSAAIVNSHAEMVSLGFFINALICFYFEYSSITEQEILRTDTLLTGSLGHIRDCNAPHFFEMFAESILRTLSKVNSVDEALSSFLSEVRTITVPGVIRYLCKILYDEAKKKFPDSNACYYAVSGFFFLRGIGPFLLQSNVKREFINPIISLFNFNVTKDQIIVSYIPKFQEILNDISQDLSVPFMFQRPSKQQLKESFAELLDCLKSNGNQMKTYIQSSKTIPGDHMQYWFLKRMLQYCHETFDSE